ncbi:MAG: hypothetical protein NVSMB18_25970 [Acetobacteraceae bacterium]
MAARIFAVLAALLLVAAVAIATLTPQGLTLGQGLVMLDRGMTAWMRAHSADWAWQWLELPFMVRPLWLVPACLGVICAGMAASLNLGSASPSRRRRS